MDSLCFAQGSTFSSFVNFFYCSSFISLLFSVKAVLESKWPTGSMATGYQLWMKLRNVVSAVAQFRTALGDEQRVRRLSVYSTSSEYDEQSIDSCVMDGASCAASEACNVGPVATTSHSVIVDTDVQRQNVNSDESQVLWSTSATSKDILPPDQSVVHEEAAAAASASERTVFLCYLTAVNKKLLCSDLLDHT